LNLPENPAYLSQQLITYLGNKRALLGFIGAGVQRVRERLGQRKLSTFDVFSGSGVVARYLRQDSERLIANDLEAYSAVINRCYLANPTPQLQDEILFYHKQLTDLARQVRPGFIAELYAPADDAAILPHERAFYTTRNAQYLDTVRQLIDEIPEHLRDFLLAPLLSQASIHANTSGVFKGFYKDSVTGRGQFGGNQRNALGRIQRDMALPLPVFSDLSVPCEVYQRDANELIHELPPLDLAYIDPPYNQHPYGANYFMLNLLVDYQRPQQLSQVSGIPTDWRRSAYNKRAAAKAALTQLVEGMPAKFLMISFNSQGFISHDEMLALLSRVGKTEVVETQYNAFRGSRNLRNRAIHVREYLFLVEKA
jgi:adenine-specific DNA-methyltransferase